jgi:hypothetical protein
MTGRIEKTDGERLADLLREKTDRAGYADRLMKACPGISAKNVLLLADVVKQIVTEAVEDDQPGRRTGGDIHLHGAHVPADWVEYPNGRVGLDSVGNISEIHVDDAFEVA